MKKMFLGFFDNYKAPFIITALLLISFFADAQIHQPPTLWGKRESRHVTDSAWQGPTGNGAPTSSNITSRKQFGLYFDSTNFRFYVYNPKLSTWDTLHVGASSSPTSLKSYTGGYRIVKDGSDSVKVLTAGTGISLDSSSNGVVQITNSNPGLRFGVSGEDATAAQNRTFISSGYQFQLYSQNGDKQQLFRFTPDSSIGFFLREHPSSADLAYMYINGADSSLNMKGGRAVHGSGIELRDSAILLKPNEGIINIDSLRSTSSMTRKNVIVWDSVGGGTYQIPASLLLSSGGGITGTLTINTIPKATGANTLGNSAFSDNGTNITTSETILPAVNNTTNLGSSTLRFSNVWASTFINNSGQLFFNDGNSQARMTSAIWQFGNRALTEVRDILFNTDNTYDIGASGATRPRTGYFGTSVIAGTISTAGKVSLYESTGTLNHVSTTASGGITFSRGGVNGTWFYPTDGRINLASGGFYGFSSSPSNAVGGTDVAISRISAGVLGVGTGTAGSVAGTLQAAANQINGATYSYTAPLQVTSAVVGPSGFNTGITLRGAAPAIVLEQTGSYDAMFGVTGTELYFGIGINANNVYSLRMTDARASFQVPLGVGVVSPSANIHSLSTAEQLRLSYSGAVYNSFTTSSVGYLTIAGNAGQTASFGGNNWTVGQWAAAGNASIYAASGGAGNSNRAGIDFNIGSGQSTGNGIGGKIFFNYTPAGSSGTSANAYATAMTIEGTSGNVGIGTTAPSALLQIGTVNPIISMKQTTSAQQYDMRIGLGTGLSSQKWDLYDATAAKSIMSASYNGGGARVNIGNAIPYASSTLYVGGGGSAGTNIDAQADGTSSKESNIEAMAINYTTGKGIAMRLWSDSLVSGSTVLGNAKQHLALLDFNEDLNIIRTNNTNPLIFGVNDAEKARLDVAGTLTAVTLKTTPVAYASLPTGAAGMVATINDSNTDVWGATAAGGGALTVMIFFNGTVWTVIGK